MKYFQAYITFLVTIILQHTTVSESRISHRPKSFEGTLGQDIQRRSKKDIETMSEQDQPRHFQKTGESMDVLEEDKMLESMEDIDNALLPPSHNEDRQKSPSTKHNLQFLNKNGYNLESIDKSLLVQGKMRPSFQQKNC